MILIIIALVVIYSVLLEKSDEKEFKNFTRFNKKWVNEYFNNKTKKK